MRHPREWFSTKPDIDDETARPERWWNWNREWCSDYDNYWYRLIIGDIAAESEYEGGEPLGWSWEAAVRLWEDTGQFDEDRYRPKGEVRREFHDHSISVCLGRWGFYLAWRGGCK